MRYVEIGARLLVGVVFVVALAGKVTGPPAFRAFVASLRAMRVVPARLAGAAAAASIAVEAVIVVLLAVPGRWAAGAGFVLAAGLLCVFAGAIALSLRRGNRAPCRCFGASATPLGRGHIVRNAGLVAVCAAGLAAAFGTGSADPAAAVVAGGAGLVAGILVTAYDDIAALFTPVR